MLAAEATAPQSETTPAPGPVRRFGLASLLLVLLPLLVEIAALDPRMLIEYREPLFAAVRLALANALPYLVAAASAGALAMVLGPRPSFALGRPSGLLMGIALVIGATAAVVTPSFHQALLAGDVRVDGACARDGGVLSSCVDLAPVALEEADVLARIHVPARAAPWQATVRWVGARSDATVPPGTRVELVAGGTARDVTAEFLALPPGGAAVFSHAVRVGPSAGDVHLRLANDPLPPSVFFDASWQLDAAGMAVDAGDGDKAWRAEAVTGPRALAVPSLRIAGEHVEGGHAVVVLSGEAWGVHDLGALLAAKGELQLSLVGDADRWRVRLVGNGAESASVPLSTLARTEEDGVGQYALPLDRLDFSGLSPQMVVGVALVYDGPPGVFDLEIAGVRAALGGTRRSGFMLGTLGVLDPGARPAEGMIAVGPLPPPVFGGRGELGRHAGTLRILAALIGLVGALGVPTLPRALRAVPFRAPLALGAGPLLVLALDPMLRTFAAPRLEHLPLALGALAVGAGVGGLVAGRAERRIANKTASAADPRLASMDAMMGVAALGVVAAHVSADASGQPWTEHPAPARLTPALVHALAAGFDAPLFVLAVLFSVACRLHGNGHSERRVIGAVARRYLPAFVVWSVGYLLLRHGKAVAFGYETAYRRELAQGATWLHAALLGGAQYHLYVLPLLLVLVLVSPLFAPAVRRPWLAFGLFATLAAWPALDAWVYAAIPASEARTWALQTTRAFGFAGYGLCAFSLFGLGGRGRGVLLSIATLVTLGAGALLVRGAWDVAESGTWDVASRALWMAAYVLPAAIFALFLTADPTAWPTPLRRLGALAPGVYLVHPAVLDAFEIAERGTAWSPTMTVGANFLGVSAVSLAIVAVLTRVRPLRFLVAA